MEDKKIKRLSVEEYLQKININIKDIESPVILDPLEIEAAQKISNVHSLKSS